MTQSTPSEHDGTDESTVLIADGGEETEEDEENEASGEGGNEASSEDENEEQAEAEASSEEEAPDEESESSSEEEDEANILYLDLEGLFVDLLGLEIDLDEVELDVTAVSGENNLLGNLLDAVAGLLDGDFGGIPGLDLSGKLEDGMESVSDAVGGWVGTVFEELEAPLQDLMTQLIRGVIEQLLDDVGSNGQQAAQAEA